VRTVAGPTVVVVPTAALLGPVGDDRIAVIARREQVARFHDEHDSEPGEQPEPHDAAALRRFHLGAAIRAAAIVVRKRMAAGQAVHGVDQEG
jgi:hypothetical protein